MMVSDQRNLLAQRLFELEAQMRQLNIWEAERPPQRALASTQPFAVDTLNFNQWLQFIFIEKMEVLLQQGLPLPETCGLLPIAEEAFKPLGAEALPLLQTINHIDDLFDSP
jgi:uncharacterized protein YqcC (DUF446 family)